MYPVLLAQKIAQNITKKIKWELMSHFVSKLRFGAWQYKQLYKLFVLPRTKSSKKKKKITFETFKISNNHNIFYPMIFYR